MSKMLCVKKSFLLLCVLIDTSYWEHFFLLSIIKPKPIDEVLVETS